jgi:neopullulanase
MEPSGLFVEHRPALPYCYYDKYRDQVVLRLITSADVDSVTLIYGDPHRFEQAAESPAGGTAPWVWRYEKAALEKQYQSAERVVWRVELPLPEKRRLKYSFKLETALRGAFYFGEKAGLSPYADELIQDTFNFFFFPFIHKVDAPSAPEWVGRTVWYQIFPERFCKGSLAGIRQKLPYLKELGVTGIYLTPVFSSPSEHKYDIADYFNVDRHFGTNDDLKALVAEAHGAGMRVMLDAVFNHIGATHPFWLDVLKNQERSPYKDYFHIHSFPVKKRYANRYDINYDTFSFVADMPKWNTENPAARKHLIDAAVYWIKECDIDAWRLDVANEVSLDFWNNFSTSVRKAKKDCYILGEIWHDASNWINPGCFDSAMNYPLGFAVSDFFLKKAVDAAAFTGRLLAALSRYSDLHNRAAFNLMDSHDTARALTLAKGDKQALRNAFTMLFLFPGSPCIYYGTEIGMAGDESANREPMIWDETQQDRDLLSFFKDLITFRAAHIKLIDEGRLRFEENGGVPRWLIGGDEGCLAAIYTGDKPLAVQEGELAFCAAPLRGMPPRDIPPHTLAVFHTKEKA